MKIKYNKEEYLQKRQDLIDLSLKINHLLDNKIIPEDVMYQKFLADLAFCAGRLNGLFHWFRDEPFKSEEQKDCFVYNWFRDEPFREGI